MSDNNTVLDDLVKPAPPETWVNVDFAHGMRGTFGKFREEAKRNEQ